MAKHPFTASKTKSDRPGWTITFRHPLKLDGQRKPGRKVRRGLGTTEAEEADRMVAQMNEILGDDTWWNPVRRREAETRFAPEIVSAFYDGIQATMADGEQLRDEVMPLPGASDGYSRVLFVGTTGAGKTTLLRQLIGSDPDEDRFPSTAPAKTTIADIEVVLAEGDYSAVVTFFSEQQISTLIEECVLDAALAAHGNADRSRVAERFLNHRDQRFRLSYVLGPWKSDIDGDDFSFDDDEEVDAGRDGGDGDGLSEAEREQNRQALEGMVERIEGLARSITQRVADVVATGSENLRPEDRDALEQLVEEVFEAELFDQEDFSNLVHDVLDAIRSRFAMVEDGQLILSRGEWPDGWSFQTSDRTEFIRTIRWFSSNFWPHFGRLLTPVVDGVRVMGPLYPAMRPQGAKLVLVDGQGIGHTPDYGASISTSVTRRFEKMDVILLVDNAQQPMQAAPLSVLRAVASMGHGEKLAIAFTHFDLIKGPSLQKTSDRRAHVMASVVSALARLKDIIGGQVVSAIEHGLDERCFMLGGTDRRLDQLPPKAATYMRRQLDGMLTLLEAAHAAEEPETSDGPTYDALGMLFAVQDAVAKFRQPWAARLGLGTYSNVRKEHWTRIKALSKRIGGGSAVEYDTLQPVADLHRQLQEAISLFLDNPTKPPAEDADRVVSRIRRLVSGRLLQITRRRLIEEEATAWWHSYSLESGKGSTVRRAERIAAIYARAAPAPDAMLTSEARALLDEVIEAVSSSVELVGGKMASRAGL
ncbi:Rab family GTPase [Sphingomonas sp. S2-65]|uniref:Rab family GTPase n=1 Tax=Sphingomonas sp. S2-65 TaxID=2903960 RepID=UPI001F328167|nr:ATP-binding protein [Sphingomonas sp. S2-65]UYY58006.1 ATP-binding protein [Sphingomonas sp. S2-65]